MPILSQIGRRALSQRLVVAGIYFVLSFLGLTMILPFMMTITSSLSNVYDYQEYRPVPRYLYSQKDRFVKGLTGFFDIYSGWPGQLAANFSDVPPTWSGWFPIGHDTPEADQLARRYLDASPEEHRTMETMAHDYADFAETYPVEDSLTPIDTTLVAHYLRAEFEARWAQAHPTEAARMSSSQRSAAALQLLNETYQISYADFNLINFEVETHEPVWQQSWTPPRDPKSVSFLDLKQAYRDLRFIPNIASKWRAFLENHHALAGGSAFPVPPDGPADRRALWLQFKREVCPATPTVPYALRAEWRKYLQSEEARGTLNLGPSESMDVAHYNAQVGTHYTRWDQIPFPLPANSGPVLLGLWDAFVLHHYPVRLMTITTTPELTARFALFLQDRFKTVPQLNALLGTSFTAWQEWTLSPALPQADSRQQAIWVDFIKTLPASLRQLHSSEIAFQQFMQARYGSLAAINQAWNTHYTQLEEVFPPFDQAYAITFANNEWSLTFGPALNNYNVIATYLLARSNAVPVTFLLIALSIFCTLTVNPLAAYALSRFNLRGQESILLFLLATSAFPAMISAIPGYLLMRDLGLLNTFFALLLPGAANGMAIFILKGFFDSLPPELFEAATIDGAQEWQIFLHITMPMVKPILAINSLTAFLGAYTGWEWALIICQNPKMWTMSVWMYQASQWWAGTPWIVNAGFIIISIPTLVVFLTCQNIILRGIVIPQMK